MATSLTARIGLAVAATFTSTADIGTITQSISETYNTSFANGSGASQALTVWENTSTIATSSADTIDLYGGLTDAFGNTINFASVKAIVIKASSANTTDITVGSGTAAITSFFVDTQATVGAEPAITLNPGATFCIVSPGATGLAVTATTEDKIFIRNASGAVTTTYDIIIIGD